jgi:hypothetical protein
VLIFSLASVATDLFAILLISLTYLGPSNRICQVMYPDKHFDFLGNVVSKGRKPKSCLGREFNLKFFSFVTKEEEM